MSTDNPYLEVTNGELKGTQFRLLAESALIGRSADCDICLEGVKGVSRQHAQILVMDGRIRVKDLGSQNGTLVDGKRVSEATVPSGSSIKVGQAILRIVIPSDGGAMPVQKRSSSRRLRPASSGQAAPAVADERGVGGPAEGAVPAEALDAESIMVVAGQGSRSFLFILFALVVGLGSLLYIVNYLTHDGGIRLPAQWIVAAGEERIIGTTTPYAGYKTIGKSADGAALIKVSDYKGLLAEAVDEVNHRNRKNGYPGLYFLVVTGNKYGNAWLVLQNRSGQELNRLEILVRGAKPHEWKDPMAAADARSAAEDLEAQAKVLEKDGHWYLAKSALLDASRLYNEGGDTDGSNRAWSIAHRIESALKKKMTRQFVLAISKAFPDRNMNQKPDYVSAFQELEDVKRLIPDDTTHDWQVVDRWQAGIRLLLSRRLR